jgi:pseudouridine synthase
MLIRFNKPYGVLSQFTPEGRWQGLKDHIDLPGVYVAGRLDADSEGLLLLTDDGKEQARIADPRFKMEKTYWVQVEGLVDDKALTTLARGVTLNDGPTLPARARAVEPPADLWPRNPPDSRAAKYSHLMAGTVHTRRPQPPSSAHDRRRGLAHAAPDPHRRGALQPGWPAHWHLATSLSPGHWLAPTQHRGPATYCTIAHLSNP